MSANPATPPDTTPTDTTPTDTTPTDTTPDASRQSGRPRAGGIVQGWGRASAADVAAAGHATARPPVWWLARRVHRERVDAIDAYRAEIALRARHSRIAAIRCGRHLGRVPYGYTLDSGRLVLDPAAAGVVAAIYRWRVGSVGWVAGVAEIVRRLGADPDRFPPPPSARPGAPGKGRGGKGGGGWSGARVRVILTDPRYTGRGVLRAARRDAVTGWTPAVVTPGRTHPALVDDHDWWAAQLVARRPPAVLPDQQEPAARWAGQGTGQW